MNLKSIGCFLVTVEEMNTTRAAECLFISRQALSSHLKRMEDEYGICLFDRKPSLRLTLEGGQSPMTGRIPGDMAREEPLLLTAVPGEMILS